MNYFIILNIFYLSKTNLDPAIKSRNDNHLKLSRAFSLIELLITLAIIGILAAIIYPNYTSHIQKSHCEVAKVKLVQLAGLLEEYNLENHSYENAGFAILKFSPDDDYYHYEMKLSADDYLLSAIPKNKDSRGILTYNQNGEFNKSDDIICEP